VLVPVLVFELEVEHALEPEIEHGNEDEDEDGF
jgi:hypothetical protein